MHELSLMENIMTQITQAQQRDGFRRVRRVHLEIGELAGVDPLALRHAFDVCRDRPPLVGAELHLRPVAGMGRCAQCGTCAGLPDLLQPCPACEACGMIPVAGDRLRLTHLDVID